MRWLGLLSLLAACGAEPERESAAPAPSPEAVATAEPTASQLPCYHDENPDGTTRRGWQNCTQAEIDAQNAAAAAAGQQRMATLATPTPAPTTAPTPAAEIFRVVFTYKVGDESESQCTVRQIGVFDRTKTFEIQASAFQLLTADARCRLSGPSILTCDIKDNFVSTSGISCIEQHAIFNSNTGNYDDRYGTVTLRHWTEPDLSAWGTPVSD